MLSRFTHPEHVQGSEQHLHGPRGHITIVSAHRSNMQGPYQQHAMTGSSTAHTPRALCCRSITRQHMQSPPQGQLGSNALNIWLAVHTAMPAGLDIDCRVQGCRECGRVAESMAGLGSPPVYLPPAPAHAMRENPTASGVMLPWPGLAMPQAYTVLIRVNVITTCGNSSTASSQHSCAPPTPVPARWQLQTASVKLVKAALRL